MYFLDGRIKRIIDEMHSLMYIGIHEINDIQVRYGEIVKPIDFSNLTDGWQNYTYGTPWTNSSSDTYAMFKAKFIIPDEFEGKKLVLSIHTNRNGWNALNPQMLLYIDGEEYQGLDTNHTEAFIDN